MIEFTDVCKITRETGEYDSHDNAIRSVVYEGNCLYEEGGASVSRLITLYPILFLPNNNVQVEINDKVEITTRTGRKREALVNIVRDIHFTTQSALNVTRVELKQTTELL